jgi:transposase InsO family protein
MPWREHSVMDERMRFVIRLKDGGSMASLCREFGIARKTGYKIFARYEQCGLEGLSDRIRRPFRYANQLPEPVKAAILAAKREKPHWGARKIRERLVRRLPHAVKVPAASTIHAVLDHHDLVKPMGRRRPRAEGTPLSEGLHPNDLWCTDCKGEFQLSDRRYCYPLTVTDHSSRYLLLCEALESNREELEAEANGVLATAPTIGAEAAMARATAILDRASDQLSRAALRARIFDLCDKLFHSIGLQTSVKLYSASGRSRRA